jgi:phosphomannomutase/phosphoglucomutase
VDEPRLNPNIFRAYDIRGVVGEDLTASVLGAIARGHGTFLRRGFGARRVVVGRDNRPSSLAMYESVIDGLRATGLDVVAIGLAPSPLLYHALHRWRLDGGIVVTASHNPVEFNGAKLLREESIPLLPEEIQDVRRIVETEDFCDGEGGLEVRDPAPRYLRMLGERFALGRPLRVVVDPGNGVATLTGPAALSAVGAQVTGLYSELLEGFPNHLPDPQEPESMRDLAARVVEEHADLGFAWDGDGDRVGVIDETGRRYDPDWIAALLARDVLSRHPGERILMDLKSSRSAIEDVRSHGGEPILARTGYSIFRRRMRDEGMLFGGEASGHMIFGEDYPYLDDGVYAACAIARIVAAEDRPLSAHFAGMRRYVTSNEIKLPCADDDKFRIADQIADTFRGRYEMMEVDGARVEFPDGWFHLRASNTNPYLSLRIEAETRARYWAIREAVWEAVRAHPQVGIPEGAGEPLPERGL